VPVEGLTKGLGAAWVRERKRRRVASV